MKLRRRTRSWQATLAFDRIPGSVHCEAQSHKRSTMYRLITASCLLALGLSLPILAADEKNDNPAANKLIRDIARHQDFLKRIEQSKGAGDVIFLGDYITQGWEVQKACQEHFSPFKPVNLGIVGDQTV